MLYTCRGDRLCGHMMNMPVSTTSASDQNQMSRILPLAPIPFLLGYSQPYIILSYSSIFRMSFKLFFPSRPPIGGSLLFSFSFSLNLLGSIMELLFHSSEWFPPIMIMALAERESSCFSSYFFLRRSINHISLMASSAVSLYDLFFSSLPTKFLQDLLNFCYTSPG